MLHWVAKVSLDNTRIDGLVALSFEISIDERCRLATASVGRISESSATTAAQKAPGRRVAIFSTPHLDTREREAPLSLTVHVDVVLPPEVLVLAPPGARAVLVQGGQGRVDLVGPVARRRGRGLQSAGLLLGHDYVGVLLLGRLGPRAGLRVVQEPGRGRGRRGRQLLVLHRDRQHLLRAGWSFGRRAARTLSFAELELRQRGISLWVYTLSPSTRSQFVMVVSS